MYSLYFVNLISMRIYQNFCDLCSFKWVAWRQPCYNTTPCQISHQKIYVPVYTCICYQIRTKSGNKYIVFYSPVNSRLISKSWRTIDNTTIWEYILLRMYENYHEINVAGHDGYLYSPFAVIQWTCTETSNSSWNLIHTGNRQQRRDYPQPYLADLHCNNTIQYNNLTRTIVHTYIMKYIDKIWWNLT